jgi:D-alanyl-D-alanine carboxypeptidase
LVGSKTVKTITNTNHLLTQDPDVWVVGGKTGYLEESKYNVVVEMRPLDDQGRPDATKDLLVVVMGSPNKDAVFATAKRLAQWAWENHAF